MPRKKQPALGDELIGTPLAEEPEQIEDAPDLDAIQADSEAQPLPEQEKIFRVAGRVRSKLSNLPDPTRPPLGLTPGRGYDVVFPFIKLPDLAPNLNGDWVQFGSPDLEPNRLYYGDNLQVLRTLDSNSIDLIYIDPPFFSGEDYNVIWGDTNEVRTFSDIWEGGLDTYLIWINARLWEMRRVLRDTGTIYVHCDSHAAHYIKQELDKIFGYEQFRNEIVWRRTGSNSAAKRFGPLHQTIFYYVKSDAAPFYPVIAPYTAQYVEEFFKEVDSRGRYQAVALTGPGTRTGDSGKAWRDYDPNSAGRHWQPATYVYDKYRELTSDDLGAYPLLERLDKLDEVDLIHWAKKEGGGVPRYKYYLNDAPGVMLQDIWGYQPGTEGCVFGNPKEGIDQDVKWLSTRNPERLGYPTQKPEGLLRRIILASSAPGDIVADFFCGGGVAPAVAQELGRKWIACDSSRVAVSVTLNRLVTHGEARSGVTSNYGKLGEVQQKMELPTPEDAVPDIRVHYVGVYPMDRFQAVDQKVFEDFILACLASQADTSDAAISGWRSAREPVRVGPANPDVAPDPEDVKDFFEAVIRRLQPNVRFAARYVCWRASPELTAYRKQLSDYIRKNIQPRGTDFDIDFLYIDSEEFRERIRQKYPDADDNEFLLRFTKEPVVGEIATTRLGPRKYRFEARDADSTNAGGYLVNCQWDFDYQRGHFAADSKFVLCRTELKGKDAKLAGHKFEAVLAAEQTFDATGSRMVACRVQDNYGAEAIYTLDLEVT